jgi:hypothetical protein
LRNVLTEEGKLHLYVGIDRTSNFAFTQLHDKADRATTVAFLEALIEAVPYELQTVLTDKGVKFADLPKNRGGWTARMRIHRFDQICRERGIERRLTKPNHPWTNGQLERMNRTIKDATVKLFREKLTRAGAIDALFAAFDRQLRDRGYLPMGEACKGSGDAQHRWKAGGGGQIVDATVVAAPKQRNTATQKEAIKAGKSAAEIWPDQPAKAAQKDTDARWTLKFAKARPLPGGRLGIDIAIPSFGYKSSIAICRRYGFIRRGKVTDGARFDGRMLRDVVTNDNTASDVWGDTAYRSRSNEAWLKSIGRVSRVHRKKPKCKPMSAGTARANAARSTVRARIEHVFARQKDQVGLFIRTIGISRAEAKITLANLAYNIDRLIFHERRAAMA